MFSCMCVHVARFPCPVQEITDSTVTSTTGQVIAPTNMDTNSSDGLKSWVGVIIGGVILLAVTAVLVLLLACAIAVVQRQVQSRMSPTEDTPSVVHTESDTVQTKENDAYTTPTHYTTRFIPGTHQHAADVKLTKNKAYRPTKIPVQSCDPLTRASVHEYDDIL
jgi:hypothetical protein